MGHTVNEFRKVPVLFIHNAVALLGGNLQGDVHLWDVGSGLKLHSLIHSGKSRLIQMSYIDANGAPEDDKILALAVRRMQRTCVANTDHISFRRRTIILRRIHF